MIYGISTWEKLDQSQPRLFTNGNTVVVQRTKFATSQEWLVLGTIFLIMGLGSFLLPFLAQGTLPLLSSLNPGHILPALGVASGIVIIGKSREGIRLRNEQGGIHPEDTLIVLDGTKKTVVRQQGTTEEAITTFQDLSLEIRIQHNNKQTEYRIVAKYPQGNETLAKTTSQKSVDVLLQNLKTRLQLP